MKKERVLIVEDELDLLDLVDFNLTRKGYITAGALDGLTAMEKIESFRPDLVVLDLMLPNIDGWEICRHLKLNKNGVPVIMLTAKCMPEDKVRGLECGADDYMTKPFNVKELLIRIENLLEKKRGKDLQRILIHEMTNRLSTIGCCSEILSKKDTMLLTEKQSMYLHSINEQVAYTTELIAEIGILIDMESGDFSLKTERCDIVEAIELVVESYKSVAGKKGLAISCKADPGVPEIEANRFAIKQVFANLVGNAVKYGRVNGSVEVSVKKDFNGVVVSVKDNGAGIPAADMPHIFEKGYRASNASKSANGSGLGLYIARTLLDRMGAAVTFGSVEGRGSAFTVFFKTGKAGVSASPGRRNCNKDITFLS